MNIKFFEIISEEEKFFKENKILNLDFDKGTLTKNKAKKLKDCEAICIFVHTKITKEILDEMPNLKYICTRSMGFDHIDIKECKLRKIKVSNVPHYGGETVAEHTFALILSLARKIPELVSRTHNENFSIDGCEGIELKGKTLGVIGPGRIGQAVIRIAKGFGMKVIAYSRHRDRKIEKELEFKHQSLNRLLKESDIVSVHVPLSEETKHLMNKEKFSIMKKGSYFVNTSRGAIVDTKALIWALDKKILAGAALDVLEGEEDIRENKDKLDKTKESSRINIFLENHKLLREKNVIITPHVAFYTKEAMKRILSGTLENIQNFKKGKLKNSVY